MEKEIKDFPGYTITDDGKVISYKFKKPRIMKTWFQKDGYENIKLCKENKIHLAAQCCEHLNRALVVERDVAEKFGFEIVTVVPKPKAGGSFGTSVYKHFSDPVVVEYIKADYGLDIGLTMIGMHMKHVCIPLRLNPNVVGETIITGAKIRPKLIGGARAEYL